MQIGYIRVSKFESNTDMQFDAFDKIGCEKIFHEKISGAAKHRPEFEKMLNILRPGDIVIVWDTSRLGRDLIEMIKIVDRWYKEGIGFKSIQEPFIDTSTDAGDMIFKFFAVLNEGERKRKIFNTNSGLAAARARGRIGGRPKGLDERAKSLAKAAAALYLSEKMTVEQILAALKMKSKATLYKYLRHEGVDIKGWKLSPIMSTILDTQGQFK